ncbi:hypothetical protein GCM10022226_61090 [Sphaerisporangium flaviroseum]|uniref:Uncharacterized protein n=1 Tax=Sphaerisporangium flaviroseum TaxID=509199 RepID=A0ABP7J0R1_9ACTN
MVHDGGHPSEQYLLVDPADDEAVVPLVDQRQADPASGDEHAAARPIRRQRYTHFESPKFPQALASAADSAA